MVPADPAPNDKTKRRPSRPSTAGAKRRSTPAAASSPAKARPVGKSKTQGAAPKGARRKVGRAPVPMVWEPVQAQAPVPAARPSRSPPIVWDPIQPQRRPAMVGRFALIGLLVFALAAMGMASQVTSAPNTGTIKVHDGATADPASRNEPHVSGDFFVEGSNMAEDGGALFIFSWPPTGTKELVVDTTWDADDGTPSFHFLVGPLTLPCGHYRVGASNGPAEPEDFPAMKSKGFWIDCAEEPEEPEPTPTPGPTTSTTTTTSPPTSTTTTTSGPEEPEEPAQLACPTGLQATALDNGDVRLDWTPAAGSDGSNVYRAVGDGDFEYVTTVAAGVGTYLDDTTVVGEGYAYTVTGLFGDEESVDCPLAETTAIPEFPTALGIGLATGGGLLALALAGRRKL
jgi:hypothetical protein